jgi:hypothetical protein
MDDNKTGNYQFDTRRRNEVLELGDLSFDPTMDDHECDFLPKEPPACEHADSQCWECWFAEQEVERNKPHKRETPWRP